MIGMKEAISSIENPGEPGNVVGGRGAKSRNLIVCPELAYVIGAVLGNGFAYVGKSGLYMIVLSVKEYEFAAEFGRCLAIATNRDNPYTPRELHNQWRCAGYNKSLCLLLKGKVINKLKPFIEHSEECIKAFIRGFADARGYVDKHGIQIKITDNVLLEYVAKLLERLGIKSKIYEKKIKVQFIKDPKIGRIYNLRHTTLYELRIGRRDELLKFRQIISFTIRQKQARLEMLTPARSKQEEKLLSLYHDIPSPLEGRRDKKGRPVKPRINLFHRVLQLREFDSKRIQEIILEETGEYISRSTINAWKRGIHTPYGDVKSLRKCTELAYVIGAVLGDGYVQHIKRSYLVELAVKDCEFAAEFAKCAAIAVGRDTPYKVSWHKSINCWMCRVYHKPLYELLKDKDLEKLRPFIEYCPDCVRAFVRGLADAEGCVVIRKHPLKGNIIIVNTNRRLIEHAAGLLLKLGIHCRISQKKVKETMVSPRNGKVYRVNHNTIYELIISRKNAIELFRRLIGFSIKTKRERLEAITQTIPPPS